MARRPRPGLRFDGAPWIRASDADRERTADFLRGHCAEGRLTLPELEQRLQVALSAWTIGDLEALTTDLPGGAVAPAGGRAMSRRRPGRSLALKVAGVVALLWLFGQAISELSEFAAWALGMLALGLFLVVCAAAFTIASVAFVVRGTEQIVRRLFHPPPRPRPPGHWA